MPKESSGSTIPSFDLGDPRGIYRDRLIISPIRLKVSGVKSLNDFLLSCPLPTRKKLGPTGSVNIGNEPEGIGQIKLAKSVQECHSFRIFYMFVGATGLARRKRDNLEIRNVLYPQKGSEKEVWEHV